MKKCRDCKEEKELSEFSVRKNHNKTGKTYFISFCKKCMSIRTKKWIEKNREKFIAYQKAYQIAHPRSKK